MYLAELPMQGPFSLTLQHKELPLSLSVSLSLFALLCLGSKSGTNPPTRAEAHPLPSCGQRGLSCTAGCLASRGESACVSPWSRSQRGIRLSHQQTHDKEAEHMNHKLSGAPYSDMKVRHVLHLQERQQEGKPCLYYRPCSPYVRYLRGGRKTTTNIQTIADPRQLASHAPLLEPTSLA